MDVVLSKARIGTRLQIDVHDPLVDAQTESISTVFLNDALRTTAGRAKLRAVSKYVPPEKQSLASCMGRCSTRGHAIRRVEDGDGLDRLATGRSIGRRAG